MIPFRTQVKFFLDTVAHNNNAVDLSAFTAVFQRWIQQKLLEGQLIDMADYRHVHEGPGIVLIGHDSDYAIENRGGRLGLLYTRKRRSSDDLPTQLRDSLRLALTACQLLESDPAFKPRLVFRTDEIELRFPDRLQFPNRPETFDLVRDDLRSVLEHLYGVDAVRFEPVQSDPRELFTVNMRAAGAAPIAQLAQSLVLARS